MTKSRSKRDVRVTVKVYAKGVTGAVLEVERWDDQTLNEASMRMKEAIWKYEDAEVRIF